MIRFVVVWPALIAVIGIMAGSSTGIELPLVRTLRLEPRPDNPRNSEGDFVQLRDGRLLLVYTHYDGGAEDHASAYLAGRFSSDGGCTWSPEDKTILANEGAQNTMSVSLVRLADGRVALFYLRQNSERDCCPYVRFSNDEAASWGEPIACIPDHDRGYYVLNNDRVIQLRSGRLVVPVAQHNGRNWKKWTPYGIVLCYLSDDGARSWRRSVSELGRNDTESPGVMLQEPGVVELKDGRLMMFCRTDAGSQYLSFSEDGGDHWSPPSASEIRSPLSPASIERIPATGDLLLVWNDHSKIDASLQGKRTPFSVGISRDEGRTWDNVRPIETNPHGWYCYTAIEFVGDQLLLGYCAGDCRENNGLAVLQVTRLPICWLIGQPHCPE